MKALPLCAAAVLAAFTASAPVLADTGTRSQSVEYSQSQLMSQAGRDALAARIDRAAQDVCRMHGARDLEAQRLQRSCVAQATTQARSELEIRVAQVSRPITTASLNQAPHAH